MNFFSKIINKNSNNNYQDSFNIGNNVIINSSFNWQDVIINWNCNNVIKWSGKVVSLEYTLSNSKFSEIESNGSIHVVISWWDKESINIKWDDNIIEHIKIDNNNWILNIWFENNISFSTNNNITIYITTQNSISNIDLSGSGEIYLSDIYDQFVNIELSWSGKINIKGNKNIDDLKIRVSGSWNVSIWDDIEVENLTVRVSGSWDVYSNNCINAKLKVSGSWDITVWKNTNIISEKISGSWDINRK